MQLILHIHPHRTGTVDRRVVVLGFGDPFIPTTRVWRRIECCLVRQSCFCTVYGVPDWEGGLVLDSVLFCEIGHLTDIF